MLATVVGGVAALYAVIVAGMYFGQRSFIYLPDTSTPLLSASEVADMSAVSIRTVDGLESVSWYRRAAEGRATLVYFHGNGGHIGYRDEKVRPYLDAGYGVFLVGYRGYGGNEGRPTEEGLYQDAAAALDFLDADDVKPAEIVLYGESLGSGVAVHAARELARQGSPVAAVILEAPFSSLADMAQFHYPYLPAWWLVKDRYESVDKIAEIDAPLLVVHGDADRIVPIRYGVKLVEAATEPKKALWVSNGRHNDLYDHGMADAVLAFLDECGRHRDD